MQRARKWLFRIVGIGAVVMAAVMFVYVNWAPDLARQQVIAQLERMGINSASVEVRSITTGRIQITNVVIGKGAGLRVGSIGIDYDLPVFQSLRIRNIDIVGAECEVHIRDGRIDFGPLMNIRSTGEEDEDAGETDEGRDGDDVDPRAPSRRQVATEDINPDVGALQKCVTERPCR